jgi:phage-related protein
MHVNFTRVRGIYFYRTRGGDCPVEAFLAGLEGRQAQKIAWVLRIVKALPMVPRHYFKKLLGTEEIWEIRADLANNAFRLLAFWDEGRLIILTNAFAKKTQKTPEHEIRLAEQRRADYLSRKKKP